MKHLAHLIVEGDESLLHLVGDVEEEINEGYLIGVYVVYHLARVAAVDGIGAVGKLDKLNVESKLTTVLYATAKDGKYIFQTHANNSTTKTPLGAFTEDEIDNDITVVLDALKEY